MSKAKIKLGSRANLRTRPDLNSQPAGILYGGSEIEVTGDIREEFYPVAVKGFIHKTLVNFVPPAPPPPPPPPPPVGKDLVGYHILGGPHNFDLLGLIERRYKAGNPVSGVTVLMVDQGTGLPAAIKAVSPTTKVLGRIYCDPEPSGAGWPDGSAWVAQRSGPIFSNPHVDYWQLANEWGVNLLAGPESRHPSSEVDLVVDGFKRFYLGLISWFKSAGKKCVVGDFGVGQVEPWFEERIYPIFEVAQREGMPVNYHAYNGGPTVGLVETDMMNGAAWHAMRWLRWAHRFQGLKWIFGEAGAGIARYTGSKQRELAMMSQLNDMLQGKVEVEFEFGKARSNPENVLFAAWWTLFPSYDWAFSDFKDALI